MLPATTAAIQDAQEGNRGYSCYFLLRSMRQKPCPNGSLQIHHRSLRILAATKGDMERPGRRVVLLCRDPCLSAAQLIAALQQRPDETPSNASTVEAFRDPDLVDEQLRRLVRMYVDDPRCHADNHVVGHGDREEVRWV